MNHQLKNGMWAKCSSHQEQRAAIKMIHAGGKVEVFYLALEETRPDKHQPHLSMDADKICRTNDIHESSPIPLPEFILRALGYWEEQKPETTSEEPEPIAKLETLFAELQSNYQALLEKTERALTAKQEAQQEPEFLEGVKEYFPLLEKGGAYNHINGSGIYIGSDREAVILPWPNNEGCSIIRFRKRK